MKCPACGYTREIKTQTVDKVIRFQQGKRKGEIKSVQTEEITLEIGHEDFKEVTLQHLQVKGLDQDSYCTNTRDYFVFFICPECKTMIANA